MCVCVLYIHVYVWSLLIFPSISKIFAKLYAGINSISFYPYIYFIDATFATHAREKPALLMFTVSSPHTLGIFPLHLRTQRRSGGRFAWHAFDQAYWSPDSLGKRGTIFSASWSWPGSSELKWITWQKMESWRYYSTYVYTYINILNSHKFLSDMLTCVICII